MPWSLIELYLALPAFVVVLARIAGVMLATPLFSGGAVPMRAKAMISVAMTLAVFPMLVHRMPLPTTMSAAVIGLAGELALGLLLGLAVSAVLLGVQIAVQVISQQAGIALGEVFNPSLEVNLPVVAELYYYVAVMIFLAIGGHRAVVATLLDSFTVVPPLGFRIDENTLAHAVDLFAVAFILAVRVAGPIILTLLLGLATLGFVSRAMPQLNLLTIGFPIKIFVALLLMAWSLTTLEPLLVGAFTDVIDGLRSHLIEVQTK